MSEYPNLPYENNGQFSVLYTEKLPEKYIVLGEHQAGINKNHVCKKEVVEESELGTLRAESSLCGVQDVAYVSDEVSLKACERCLSILNKKMEACLFDEKEQEYYFSYEA